jgi:Tol biopolymer transport system component
MRDATDLLERISVHLPAPEFEDLLDRRARKLRRRRTTAGAMALVLTAVLLGTALVAIRLSIDRGTVATDGLAPSGRIAFTVYEGNGWHVGTVNVDGSERQILTDGVRDYATSWSPDGLRIAFDREGEDGGGIWVMNADGTDLNQLTAGSDVFPRWSPDGTQIVFARYGEGMYSADEFTRQTTSYLRVVNADGTDERQLTDGKVGDVPGTWSPDGASIAFLRSSEDGSGIWTIRLDGSHAEELVHFGLQLDGTPAWSPEGSRLLYPHDDGIWLVDADGSDAQELIEGATDPSWSPDGSWIAFSRDGDIWIVRSDGSDEQRVTSGPDEEIQPTWGPVAGSRSPEDSGGLKGAELARALGLEAHRWTIGTAIEATPQGVVLDGEIPSDCAVTFPGEVVIVQQVGDGTFYCPHGETYADAWALGQSLLGSIPTEHQVRALDTNPRPPFGGMPEDVDGDGLISDRGAERTPELILAADDSGVAGYIRFEDSEGPQPSNPQDAVAMNGRPWIIPIYAEDGITIIDRLTAS